MTPLAIAMTPIFRGRRCPRSPWARYGSDLRRGRVPFPDGKGFSLVYEPLNIRKKAKAMKGMKRRAMRKKKAAAPEEAPMKAMRRK